VFAVAVELLTGRYTAMQFNDRDLPEWPPHPARLFSAMVAAWADNDEPDPAERSALRWLEDQEAPTIRCGRGHERNVVTHFVPVNDATALMRDLSNSYRGVSAAVETLRREEASGDSRSTQRARTALAKAKAKAVADAAKAGQPTGRETESVLRSVLQVLPENRGKQGRNYPTILPEESTVWFIWADAQPTDQQFRVLDGLLGRVGRVGHSSTFVSCRCVIEAPEPTWVPGAESNGARLRVPRTGSLSALEDAYTTHRGEEPRTLPAGMVNYGPPGDDAKESRPPLLGGDWYILGIKGKRLPYAGRALALTRAVRNALLAHSDQAPPPFISGHQETHGRSGATPPLERPHLAIVPLINAGNRYSDGAIFGIALVLPRECPDADRRVLASALRAWGASGLELLLPAPPGGRSVRWELEDPRIDRTNPELVEFDAGLPKRQTTTTRNYWCRESRSWATVTPIALDRFPGKLRSAVTTTRERAEVEAADSIARACVFGGLAERPDQVRVSIRLDAPLVGLPASPLGKQTGSRHYPSYHTGSGTPRACVHAEIEFDEPVQGPVLIGAGRYFGYGLCLPVQRSGEGGWA
jgi:CRISPR-associated protein Csb2